MVDGRIQQPTTVIQQQLCSFYFLLFSYLNMSMNFKVVFSLQFIVFSLNRTLITFLLITLLWRITESNRWPPACKAGALASWANPPFSVGSVQYSVFSNSNFTSKWLCELSTLEFPFNLFIWTFFNLLTKNCRLITSFCCLGQTRTVDPYIISVIL